jgi:hypothetical protein
LPARFFFFSGEKVERVPANKPEDLDRLYVVRASAASTPYVLGRRVGFVGGAFWLSGKVA